MFLIPLLKILFWFIVTGHCIRWVSYHIRHRNKKARVFHGNCRMPFDVEFALMYGLFARRKKRFKDLSYRKPLEEWMQLVNSKYSPDEELIIPSDANPNLVTPKSPKGGFDVEGFSNENRKQFPFIELKNKNSNPISNIPISQTHTNLKSPLGDLGVKTGNRNFSRLFIPLLF